MGIASIRHFSRRPISVQHRLVTSRSRKLTPLLAARADSPEPRGALSWSEHTWSHQVPTERTSPSARFTGALLPQAQLTESGLLRAERRCRAEVYILFPASTGEPAVAQQQAPRRRTTGRFWTRVPQPFGREQRIVAGERRKSASAGCTTKSRCRTCALSRLRATRTKLGSRVTRSPSRLGGSVG